MDLVEKLDSLDVEIFYMWAAVIFLALVALSLAIYAYHKQSEDAMIVCICIVVMAIFFMVISITKIAERDMLHKDLHENIQYQETHTTQNYE